MRFRIGAVLAVLASLSMTPALAQGPAPDAVRGVLGSLNAGASTEAPTLLETEDGFFRFISAPEGARFEPPAAQKAASPQNSASAYLEEHGAAFGVTEEMSLPLARTLIHGDSTFVRLNQQYAGVEVFGAQIAVEVLSDGSLRAINSDILRDTRTLDSGAVPLLPAVGENQAVNAAKAAVATYYSGVSANELQLAGAPKLQVFDPSIINFSGPARLVWNVRVERGLPSPIGEVVLIDTQSGVAVFHHPTIHNDLERLIFDADNGTTVPNQPARQEDDPATGNAEVDAMYDFLGDTYNYYFERHQRDSIDDEGLTLLAVVALPFFNAFWTGSEMLFGTGLSVDDVVAHEYTHGVTQYTSDLIYFGFSGAINESMSDIFGEFVDLTNTGGNDSPEVRWFIGEDITIPGEGGPGEEIPSKQNDEDPEIPDHAFRYMKDPTLLGQPDRLGSPLLADPTGFFDDGGVHINSGIGNKLAYLLTDGGTFNGQNVAPLGINLVSELFYRAQFLLTPGSDYGDLFLALGTASVQMGFDFGARLNVATAGRAVEIAPNALDVDQAVRNFRATPTRTTGGDAVIAVTWSVPVPEAYNEVILVRRVGRFAQDASDGEIIARGQLDSYLDEDVQEGVEYFYTLIVDLVGTFPQLLFTRAVAGAPSVEIPAQLFTGNDFDLSFNQITFTPVGAPARPLSEGAIPGTFGDYEVSVADNVATLPIRRNDATGGAFHIYLSDDDGTEYVFSSAAFPFFGTNYTSLYVASNGYISFNEVPWLNLLNFPSLNAHFAIPRISFLFTDLAPNSGGQVWIKQLDDRLVVTFEEVPEYTFTEFGLPPGNTVQTELYFSGQIRITYGSVVVEDAIVGLSDGNGVPVDPATVFDDVESTNSRIDFTQAPTAPTRLHLEPLPSIRVDGGETATFSVRATASAPGIPVLTAEWDGPGPVPFADRGNGTGTFLFRTTPSTSGLFNVRIVASLGAEITYQDVRVSVGQVFLRPEAQELLLSTGTPLENPAENRLVSDIRPLTASYTYFHPQEKDDPELFGEGATIIYWFRNDQLVVPLINSPGVAASLTQPGDRWYFRVLPRTASFIEGQENLSPVVTVAGFPEILSITPGFGPITGGTTVRITGSRLSGVTNVRFGGVDATGIRNISDSEIEVVTPVRNAGSVTVTVTTTNGTGFLPNGFIFVGDPSDIINADLNRDGKVDAVDIQLVVSAVLKMSGQKADVNPDANRDGSINASDVQVVVNRALRR